MASWKIVRDHTTQKRYTVLVDKEGGNKGADVEGSQISVTITDGNVVWENQAVKKPPETRHTDWMERLRTALTAELDSTYTFGFVEGPGRLTVNARWSMPGVESVLKISFMAEQAPHMDTARMDLHNLFVDGFIAQKTTITLLQKQLESYQRDASAATEQIEEYLSTKERREQDLFVKFAALLDMKKEKLRQMHEKEQDGAARTEESGGSPLRSAGENPADSIFSAKTDPSTSVAKQYVSNIHASSASGKQQASGGSNLKSDAGIPVGVAEGTAIHDTAASLDLTANDDWMNAPTQPVLDDDDANGAGDGGEEVPKAHTASRIDADAAAPGTTSAADGGAGDAIKASKSAFASPPQLHGQDMVQSLDDDGLPTGEVHARAKRRRR